MSKEEITYKIPNNQIHISEIKDEDCLIWISPKALNMANTIDELLQENKKYKEVGNTYKKRCQLAIEYIESKEYEYGDEEQDNYIYDIGFDEVNELLDILKGMK